MERPVLGCAVTVSSCLVNVDKTTKWQRNRLNGQRAKDD